MVYCEDTRVTGKLLMHLGISKPLKPLHQNNEHLILEKTLSDISQRSLSVYCSDAGTPAISDPGFMLVRACIEKEIDVECLPGAAAFLPALVLSGLPCERFVFEGFLPQKKGRMTRLQELKEEPRTIIFYESPHRITKMLLQLVEVFGGDRKASLSRELSKKFEETFRGTLTVIAEVSAARELKGEMVVIVSGKER